MREKDGWVYLLEDATFLPTSTDRFAFARSAEVSYLPSILYGSSAGTGPGR